MKSQRIACLVAGTALALSTVFGATKLAYADAATDTYATTVITKELKTVPGQALTEQFTFTFAAYNDTNNVNPALDPATVSITTNDAGAVYKFDANTAQVTYYANTADLIDSIKTKFADAKTGIYEYKVVETKGSTPNMTYDDSVYFLRVIKEDGGVKTQVIKADESKTKPGDVKVNPTADKDRTVTTKGEPNTEYKGSDFAFKNSYKLGDNALLDKELTLTKNVDGLDAAGTQYNFTVKFVTPDADNAGKITAVYTGGEKATVANDGSGSFSVSLSRGESVKFSGIQEGALYTVTETSTGAFVPSSVITTGADTTSLSKAKAVTGEKGTAYTVDFATTNQTIVAGTTDNSITVTNTYEKVNPTGIIINNLPFVLMVGIPVVAAAGYVVSRRKA